MQVISALAQITQEEDSTSASEKLGQFLQTLRNKVEEAWAQYTAENTNALGLFSQQKDLWFIIAKLKTYKEQFQLQPLSPKLLNQNQEFYQKIRIVKLKIQQKQEKLRHFSFSNKRSRNQNLFEDANDLYHSFDVEYEIVTTGRRQELVLVNKLKDWLLEELLNNNNDVKQINIFSHKLNKLIISSFDLEFINL
ncbi:unnamed protein product [Paramecium primaurelia]|uniref:Uncharacterized protein n=1 Tax=Paramecium primaurelia TaxID=5886 RepID=A0A8S1NWA4_PARPR|nr:unnamed protein product [Paramecium primaurelia]